MAFNALSLEGSIIGCNSQGAPLHSVNYSICVFYHCFPFLAFKNIFLLEPCVVALLGIKLTG